MLKKRVTNLIVQYEYGAGGCITANEVLEELEEIMDDEPWDEPISRPLQNAIGAYILARYEYERYGAHVDNGNDEFIEALEKAIDYEFEPID